MKPIIGIASCSSYKSNDNIFDDRYYILNNYINPIIKNGGIPIGILYNDERLIKDSLKICDAFIIPGGSKIIKAHLEIIDYAIKNNKPLLGICMGMQAISIYSLFGKKGIKKENKNVVLIKNNLIHNMDNPKRNKKDKVVHNIKIKRNSLLFSILNKEKVLVNSLHNYHVLDVGPNFKITAISDDDIIEAIEHKNKFILGVEWHPELLPNMNLIFKKLVDEAKDRLK